MDYLVEFLDQGGARIIKDPLLIERKKDSTNVLINPDIRHLRGVSPSFWIRESDDTISFHSFEIAKKMVIDSLEDRHPFETPKDAPFSDSSKFITKIREIDAKQEDRVVSLSESIQLTREDLLSKIYAISAEIASNKDLSAEQIRGCVRLLNSTSEELRSEINKSSHKQEQSVKNLSNANSRSIKSLEAKIEDMGLKMDRMKLDLDEKDQLQEVQIKSLKIFGLKLYFLSILAMILLKFL